MAHQNSNHCMARAAEGAFTKASAEAFTTASEAIELFELVQNRCPSAMPGAHPGDDTTLESDPKSLAPATAQRQRRSPPTDLAPVASEDLLCEILRRLGEDPTREGLRGTPERIVRSWEEIYAGYRQRSEEILVTQFQAERYDEMVLLRDIEFYSTREHHMLPFHGKAHIAYLPDDKILGLSKLARLLDMYARRPQVQERLTQQVATELHKILKPRGVAVMIEAKHQCMCCRGVGKQEATMVTSCLLGLFKENLASRTEFLALVRA